MKYINTFENFDLNKEKPDQPLEIMADMQIFNKSEKDIKELETKNNVLSNIYLNYVEDPNISGTGVSKDLFNKLKNGKFLKSEATQQKLLWENPFFRIYSEIYSLQREIKKIDETVNLKKQDLINKQTALQQNQGDKSDINKDIQNIQQDITDKLSQIENKKQQMENMKQTAKKELDLVRRDLENSKKRITTLKKPT